MVVLDQCDIVNYIGTNAVLVELQEMIYQASDPADGIRVFELSDGIVEDGEPHLKRIAWHIDREKLWRSFVLQQADLGQPEAATADQANVNLLLIDTAQYRDQPMLEAAIPSGIANYMSLGFFDTQIAGLTGGFHTTQLDAANAFTEAMRRENTQWILASHHPFDMLGRNARGRINKLRDAGGIPATLSSHSHAGGLRWNRDGSRDGDWLEINVGSLLDPPQEFRDFQVFSSGDRFVIGSQRFPLEDALREKGLLVDELPGYLPGEGAEDNYLEYKSNLLNLASDIDFKVKRILLAAYQRMYGLFPADHPDQSGTYWPVSVNGGRLESHDAVVGAIDELLSGLEKSEVRELTQFLYELREYDRTRRLNDDTFQTQRAYRLTQAIWAARAEYKPGKPRPDTLDANLSFIALPSSSGADE